MCIWTSDWFCFSIENIRSGDTCIITYQLCYLYILTFKTTWTFLSDHILDPLPLLDLSTILQVIMFRSHYTSMHSQLDILRHLLSYVLPHFLSRQNNCALIMINLCFCLTYYITRITIYRATPVKFIAVPENDFLALNANREQYPWSVQW